MRPSVLSSLRLGGLLLATLGAAALTSRLEARTPVADPSTVDGQPRARVSPASVPATGEQAVDIEVPAFGRYAILAVGGSGSAITLVDRLSGPLARDGVPGRRSGRIDAVLDAGRYRVRVESPADGTGAVAVELRPYAEKNAPLTPLAEGTVQTTLSDLEERGWWFSTDGAEPVFLDAIGRSLGDLRLWRDGIWAVDPRPSCGEARGADGELSGRCTLIARLPAGLYRVVATGGPARPRANGDGAEPLWVRRGLETQALGVRPARSISPFGVDRLLIAGGGAARASLPAAGALSLEARTLTPSGLGGVNGRGSIAADAREPATTLTLPNARVVLQVVGTPGQRYDLQLYRPAPASARLSGVGPHLFATLPVGWPGDELDQTAIAVAGSPSAIVAASAVPLAPGAPWRRRFNLRGASSLYVDVKTAGIWHFEANDVQIRVEPPTVGKPVPGYRQPDLQRDAVVADLPAGLQRVDLVPRESGVVELVMRHEGDPVPATPSEPRVSARFLDLQVARGREPTVQRANISGVAAMQVELPMPLLLDSPLPLVLGAGESLDLPVAPTEARDLASSAPEVLLSLDGGREAERLSVSATPHTLRLRNQANTPVFVSVGPPPAAAPASAPEPDQDRVPRLTAKEAVAGDIEAGGAAQWRVSVPEAGAWRVESTGLLALQGALRDRTGAVRGSGSENGSGRNTRIDALLPAGESILELRALAGTAGHYGLRLTRLAPEDGGALRPGGHAWAVARAGTPLAFRLEIAEAGRYAVRAECPGASPALTLTDPEGWPLYAPGTPLEDLELRAGVYGLSVLPLEADANLRAGLVRLDAPPEREGHGPFPLVLGERARHTWWEPRPGEEGAAREPDRWTFTLPASVDVRVRLGAGMEATLVSAAGARVDGVTDGWTGALERGSWTLEARAKTPDSGLSYAIAVEPLPLVAGAERRVALPGTLPVVVGEAGVHALASVASADLRMRLTDGAGRVVMEADDRPGAWDFARTGWLEPGSYTLRLSPVGRQGGGSATVSLRRLEPEARGALSPGQRHERPTGSGSTWEVELTRGQLFVARAESAENLGLALERAEGSAWRTAALDEGPAPWVAARGPAKLRLRLWSLDERGLDATLRVATGRASTGESALRLPGEGAPTLAVAEGRGGVLRREGPSDARICAEEGSACARLDGARLLGGEDGVLALALHDPAARSGLALVREAPPREASLTLLPGARLPATGGRGLTLLEVDASAALPWLGCAEGRCAAHARPAEDGGRTTLLAAAAADLRLGGGAGALPVNARIRSFEHPSALGPTLPWSGRLEAGGALRLDLAAKGALGLSLSPGLVARVIVGEDEDTLAADGEGLLATLAEGAERIEVVNPTGKSGAIALRAAAGPDTGASLLSWNAESRGLLLLSRQGPGTLRLAGSAREAVALRDAEARQGAALALGPGAWSVRVEHGPGPLAIWQEVPGEKTSALLVGLGAPRALRGRSARVPLSGEALPLALPAGEAGPLTVTAPGASALVLTRADGRSELLFPDADGRFDLLLDGAAATLTLRSLGGPPLWGEAELAAVAQGALPEDGAGEAVFLAPGERRAYPVELDAPATLALGVRAEPEGARILVFGPDGARLAEGVLGRVALPAGRSWLLLRAAADGGPVTATPLVHGREGPEGVPPDLPRSYAILDGRAPSDAVAPVQELEEAPRSYGRRGEAWDGGEGGEGDSGGLDDAGDTGGGN